MKTVGIDVSKLTIDVWSEDFGHHKFSNDKEGFVKFKKLLSKGDYCVMESTGCYHMQLATFLYEKGLDVSVANPLVVKRFIQMKQQKLKTDKNDAKMIALFGEEQSPELWEPEPEYIEQSKEILSTVSVYIKQQTQLKNKLESLTSKGTKKGVLVSSLRRQLKSIKTELEKLEMALEVIVNEHAPKSLTNLRSIPGVGKKTAILFIVTTNNFRDFDSSKQVTAYVGLNPVERSSGTSIRGRSYISKKGSPMLRNHLFMCSFTASKCNPQCNALYERIVGKGKSKKLALTAVCNKLIKQAYGVCKNELLYDKNYKGRKAA